MVDRLRSADVLRSESVEQALRSVPRHLFIDGATVETAYLEEAVPVKTLKDGSALSSVSQPAIVAAMLEFCQLEPAHRVLEVGTGTGYNAALLSRIVGVNGHVTTVELEHDLAVAAMNRLDVLGSAASRLWSAMGSSDAVLTSIPRPCALGPKDRALSAAL